MYLLAYKKSTYCFYDNLLDLYKDWGYCHNHLIFNKKHYKKYIKIFKIPSEKISTKFLLEDFESCENFFRKSDKKCLK